MSDPIIADNKPVPVQLGAGEEQYWCACGRSKTQPFCDGSHQGTDFSPVAVEITDKKKYGMCGCKHTANPPFCDGSHNQLD